MQKNSVFYFLCDGTGENVNKSNPSIVHHFLKSIDKEAAIIFVKNATAYVKYQGQSVTTFEQFINTNPNYAGDFVTYLPGPGSKKGSFAGIELK